MILLILLIACAIGFFILDHKYRWYGMHALMASAIVGCGMLLVFSVSEHAQAPERMRQKLEERQLIVAACQTAENQKSKRLATACQARIDTWNIYVENYHHYNHSKWVGFMYSNKLSDALEVIDPKEVLGEY